MSIKISKAGIADSIQDKGRYGFQHLGINPTGAMDLNAMHIANALVGNSLNEAVIELQFPASAFHFKQPALIAISGADFLPTVNGKPIPLNQPCMIPADTELSFRKIVYGRYGYLSIHGGLDLPDWLASKSTNSKEHFHFSF